MLVGLSGLEPEDKIEKHKITENIGFNSSRRNILRNQNLNMNILPEKTKDDVDKLTYHYLELSDSPKEEIELDKNINTTKSIILIIFIQVFYILKSLLKQILIEIIFNMMVGPF